MCLWSIQNHKHDPTDQFEPTNSHMAHACSGFMSNVQTLLFIWMYSSYTKQIDELLLRMQTAKVNYPMSEKKKNLLVLATVNWTTVTALSHDQCSGGHLGRQLEIPWVRRPLRPLHFKRWHLQVLLGHPRTRTDGEFKVFQWYAPSQQISFRILSRHLEPQIFPTHF